MGHDSPSMRTRFRSTTALAAGSAANGLLAYVFFALVTRQLGAAQAAPVSVLWAYWTFASAALTFPLQHWVARSVTAHRGERHVRAALPGVAGLVALVAVAAGAVSWLVRDRLFHDGGAGFPMLVVAVTLLAALTGVVRGVLSGRGRFGAVAAGLAAENALRCLIAVALVLADVDAPAAYAVALPAGYLSSLAWFSTLRLRRDGDVGTGESAAAFLGGAAAGQLIGQAVLTGGPVLLALAGGARAEVTALFAALALFRAPYTLALGLVAQLTSVLTGLVLRRDRTGLRRVRRLVVAGALVGSAVAALVGWGIGPELLRLVFGAGTDLPARLTLVVAVGSAVALANLAATLLLLAHGRTGAAARSWALALAPAAVTFLAVDASVLARTCLTFLVAEAVALVLLLAEDARATARLR
jgi:O-antigen/teichoic acid export membrane protein